MTNIYGFKKQIDKLKKNKKEIKIKDKFREKRILEKIDNAIKRRKKKIINLRGIRGKKGSLYLGFLFAFFFFIFGMLMIPFMKDSATDARTNIQCTNSSISDGTKVTCLITDSSVPYFIIVILTLVGGFIGKER